MYNLSLPSLKVYSYTWESFWLYLKDSVTRLRLPEWVVCERSKELRIARAYFLMLFDVIFMFNFKNTYTLCWFLIWQVLCRWWVTTSDQSHPLVYTWMIDSTIVMYPKMKKSIVTFLAGRLPPFIRVFCNRNCTLRLLLLLASDHWSPVPICGCYS